MKLNKFIVTIFINIVCIPVCATKYFSVDGLTYELISSTEVSLAWADDLNVINVNIPSQVTNESETYNVVSIRNGAFDGCKYMTSCIIPNSVISIGSFAFRSCSGLQSISIPDNVTTIGKFAFQGCKNVTSLKIGNGLTSISERLFEKCESITSVTIPPSVTSIGKNAFMDCISLKTFIFPNSITSIGINVFIGCSSLDTMVFHCNEIRDYCCYELASLKNVVIGDEVQKIGEHAFAGCTGLISVTIPNSVTSIGANAFAGCTGLTSVSIPNSVTSIEEYTFYNCSSLTSITIPNSVIIIDKNSFIGCTSLTSLVIPNSVTSIGRQAFHSCSGLTTLVIPNSVKSIGSTAFDYCTGLTSIYSMIENPFKIKGIKDGDNTFSVTTYQNARLYVPIGTINRYKETKGWQDFKHIEEGTWPNGEGEAPVNPTPGDDPIVFGTCGVDVNYSYKKTTHSLAIYGDGAMADYDYASNKTPWFSYANEIQRIEIGSGVTTIGNFAFYKCSGVTSITLPATVTSIGSSAFEECTSLTSLSLNEELRYIGGSAFESCSGLQTLRIPGSVNTVSIKAFAGCSGITEMYCFAEKVPETHSKAFDGTPTEKSTLYVPASSVNAYRSSWPWSNFNNILAIGSTPADDLKDYLYEAGTNNNWGSSEQPLYSANRDGIYRGFFYAQEADWSGGKGAFKFTGAFNSWEEGNYGLGHINADGLSGTLIDDGGSDNILATPGFYCADVNLGNMTYELTPISSIGIIGPAQAGGWDTDTDLTYNPETLAWEGTMKLAAEEFKFRANDSWDINWGGIAINNLKQDGPNLSIDEAGTYFIQFFPLCETKSYATLTLVSEPTPDDYPTSGSCGETVDYSYDKANQTLTIFGKGAIYDYDNGSNKAPWSAYADEIRKIEIESGITSVGYFAFYKCSGITSLSIPATVGYIGSSSFEDCTSLTSLSLSEGLLYIGGSAFEGCPGLQTLLIPSSVNTISINAFKNCKGITDVYCYAETVPDTHFDAFDGTPTELATLHVPAKTVEVYRASWPWSDFKEIVALTNEDIVGIQSVKQSEDRNDLYYDLTGRKVSHPLKGIYIKNGKKVVGK